MQEIDLDRLTILSLKYVSGQASPEEEQELNAYLDLPGNQERFIEIISKEGFSKDLPIWEEAKTRKKGSLEATRYRIAHANKHTLIVSIRRWGLVAAVAIGMTFCYWGYERLFSHRNAPLASTTKADLFPGGDKATLTLSDGRQVKLDSSAGEVLEDQGSAKIARLAGGQLAYQTISEHSTAVPLFNTLATPRAGQFSITLPDGSRVWLNNASALRYPISFTGTDSRTVFLDGEAYFEVRKDADKPFIIKVGDQEVHVLGTKFDIAGYQDEAQVRTVLIDGSVKVDFKGNTVQLRPGQQATNNGDGLSVSVANIRSTIAWKNGFFSFNKASIADILKQLSRWYDVQVPKDSKEIEKDRRFDGLISRDLTLRQVLGILEEHGMPYEYDEKAHAIIEEKNER